MSAKATLESDRISKKEIVRKSRFTAAVSVSPGADQNPGTIDCAIFLRLCLHAFGAITLLPILLLLLFEFRSTDRFRFRWHSPPVAIEANIVVV